MCKSNLTQPALRRQSALSFFLFLFLPEIHMNRKTAKVSFLSFLKPASHPLTPFPHMYMPHYSDPISPSSPWISLIILRHEILTNKVPRSPFFLTPEQVYATPNRYVTRRDSTVSQAPGEIRRKSKIPGFGGKGDSGGSIMLRDIMTATPLLTRRHNLAPPPQKTKKLGIELWKGQRWAEDDLSAGSRGP